MLSAEELRTRWQGVVIPLVTPFREDRSLDLPALENNVRWLLSKGARTGNTVLLAAGSGGDFTSMTTRERKQVIEAVCRVADGRVPVIAGAQSTDIRACIEICQFGEKAGLDAVQLSGPYYYDGRPGDVLAWMEEVARHTEMGFAAYNNWYTGYDMPLDLIDQLLEIPNSIAVKWASPNVLTFMEGIRRFNAKAVVIDNAFLPEVSYLLGVRCHVSHLPNFYPEHSWRVHDLLVAGEYAEAKREWDRCMIPWLRLVSKVQASTGGEGVFVRPMMQAAGLTGGYSRLPSRDDVITPELRQDYERLLSDFRSVQ
jgi:dihydrodipicolinate synthase/N-acetylneuraminate lyase